MQYKMLTYVTLLINYHTYRLAHIFGIVFYKVAKTQPATDMFSDSLDKTTHAMEPFYSINLLRLCTIIEIAIV